MAHHLQEDVYETEDVPSPEREVEEEEHFEDLDIQKIHVDVDAALKHFGRRLLNADDADFSDDVVARGRSKRRGYRSEHYVLELVGPEYEGEESIEQKFRRLRYELEELSSAVDEETQSKAGANTSTSTTVDKNELERLNELLKAACVKRDTPTVTANHVNAIEDGPMKKAEKATIKDPSSRSALELSSLEERILRIERALGDVDGGSGSCSSKHPQHGPLIEAVENLRIQLETLNPAYLEGINSHLSTALSKLEELDERRSKAHGEDGLDTKVGKLYDMVNEWNATCTNLPSIVKRLHATSKLHEQAQEFSSKLNEVSGAKQHVERKLEDHKVLLFELKKESVNIVAELSSKIAGLEKRISALTSK